MNSRSLVCCRVLHQSILAIVVILYVLSVPSAAAQMSNPKCSDKGGLKGSFECVDDIEQKGNIKPYKSATEFVIEVIRIVLAVTAIGAAGVLVAGGVMHIVSLGNEEKAKKARLVILYAVIGLLIIGAAALIVNVVTSIYRSSGGAGGGGQAGGGFF